MRPGKQSEPESTGEENRATVKSRRRRRRRYVIAASVLLLLIALVYLSAGLYGRGSRGRFDPYSFEVRSQTEWREPVFLVPVYRSSWREGDPYPLVAYLQDQGYWQPVEAEGKSDLGMYVWNQRWRDGQSMVYRELHWQSDRWIAMTEERPDLAEVLWPWVLDELRHSSEPHYTAFVLLAAAREAWYGSQSPEQFVAAAKKRLADALGE